MRLGGFEGAPAAAAKRMPPLYHKALLSSLHLQYKLAGGVQLAPPHEVALVGNSQGLLPNTRASRVGQGVKLRQPEAIDVLLLVVNNASKSKGPCFDRERRLENRQTTHHRAETYPASIRPPLIKSTYVHDRALNPSSRRYAVHRSVATS